MDTDNYMPMFTFLHTRKCKTNFSQQQLQDPNQQQATLWMNCDKVLFFFPPPSVFCLPGTLIGSMQSNVTNWIIHTLQVADRRSRECCAQYSSYIKKTSLGWQRQFLLRTPPGLSTRSCKELVKTPSNSLSPLAQWKGSGPLLRCNCRRRWVQTPAWDAGQSWYQDYKWVINSDLISIFDRHNFLFHLANHNVGFSHDIIYLHFIKFVMQKKGNWIVFCLFVLISWKQTNFYNPTRPVLNAGWRDEGIWKSWSNVDDQIVFVFLSCEKMTLRREWKMNSCRLNVT